MNTVLSLNALMIIFGVLIGPIINGSIVDYTGTYWSTFYIAGGLLVAGAIAMFTARMAENFRRSKLNNNEVEIEI